MPLEIERKFLVKHDGWKSYCVRSVRIRDGLLASSNGCKVRVRISDTRATLAVKGPEVGISRPEFEYEIPLQDAREMLQHVAEKPFIDKTRYRVRHGEHIWDLDLFAGENAGLIVAEVELESESQPFELPPWAGEEVSDDTRYYNVNLVKHPYSRW